MAINPQNPHSAREAAMLRDVAAAVRARDLASAAQIANMAIGQGFRRAAFFNARALWFQETGLHMEALNEFRRALSLTPRDFHLLNAIGLCLVRVNQPQEALAMFETALEIDPYQPDTRYRKGWAHEAAGELGKARTEYEKAVALQSDHAESLASLATMAARAGDLTAARDFADRALRTNPMDVTALVALSIVDNSEKNFAATEARLKPLTENPALAGHPRAIVLGFLADALDGQGKTKEAFEAYKARNDEFLHLHQPRFQDAVRVRDLVAALIRYFENTQAAKWATPSPAPADPAAPKEHVFLLGFLRSGTTLLEQVLATHPDTVILEERETFSEASRAYLTSPGGLDRLVGLNESDLQRMRADYWAHVKREGVDPAGKVFIDKQPLNTFNLALISRLFPNAKILFALRDPRDVVFSCYRRHFDVNATMFEFLRLDDAARFYAQVMKLAALSREKLPLNVFEHKYEDMIADFDGRVRAVCDFLGIEWTDAMRDFSENARNREIRSPSAAQVRKPLYSEGVEQWRQYADQLAPALPILAPWVERFGYPAG